MLVLAGLTMSIKRRRTVVSQSRQTMSIQFRRQHHCGIGYLRPSDLHDGNQHAIIEHRQATLDAAAAAHPERFTTRPTPPKVPTKAWINKPSIQSA